MTGKSQSSPDPSDTPRRADGYYEKRQRRPGPPRPVREDLKPRERQRKIEHLQFLAVALLIGLAMAWVMLHASAPAPPTIGRPAP